MRRSLCKLALLLAAAAPAYAYSVLSHEALVDAAWEDSLKPLLLKRYPGASAEDLQKAHAYAYGGAIIQDMGYYPFGSHLFSDLTHYVRSGDFVVNMIGEAHDLNEYAFALGSLAHYAADNGGHPSVNLSVPLLYPKVRRKFPRIATYEDDPADHLKAEFSFDVAQVSEQHYAPEAYHNFIGFEVSKPLLERAFEATYGVQLKDISKTVDLALGTYRRTVSSIIPQMTKVAWQVKKKDLMKADPGMTQRRFVYAMSRASYEKEWGSNYEKPGRKAALLSLVFRFMPRIGPFKALAFHPATAETQKMFMDGFVKTVALYKDKLAQVQGGTVNLPNNNFDTGEPSAYGKYRMADEATAKLVEKLSTQKEPIDPGLRKALAGFYGDRVPAMLQ